MASPHSSQAPLPPVTAGNLLSTSANNHLTDASSSIANITTKPKLRRPWLVSSSIGGGIGDSPHPPSIVPFPSTLVTRTRSLSTHLVLSGHSQPNRARQHRAGEQPAAQPPRVNTPPSQSALLSFALSPRAKSSPRRGATLAYSCTTSLPSVGPSQQQPSSTRSFSGRPQVQQRHHRFNSQHLTSPHASSHFTASRQIPLKDSGRDCALSMSPLSTGCPNPSPSNLGPFLGPAPPTHPELLSAPISTSIHLIHPLRFPQPSASLINPARLHPRPSYQLAQPRPSSHAPLDSPSEILPNSQASQEPIRANHHRSTSSPVMLIPINAPGLPTLHSSSAHPTSLGGRSPRPTARDLPYSKTGCTLSENRIMMAFEAKGGLVGKYANPKPKFQVTQHSRPPSIIGKRPLEFPSIEDLDRNVSAPKHDPTRRCAFPAPHRSQRSASTRTARTPSLDKIWERYKQAEDGQTEAYQLWREIYQSRLERARWKADLESNLFNNSPLSCAPLSKEPNPPLTRHHSRRTRSSTRYRRSSHLQTTPPETDPLFHRKSCKARTNEYPTSIRAHPPLVRLSTGSTRQTSGSFLAKRLRKPSSKKSRSLSTPTHPRLLESPDIVSPGVTESFETIFPFLAGPLRRQRERRYRATSLPRSGQARNCTQLTSKGSISTHGGDKIRGYRILIPNSNQFKTLLESQTSRKTFRLPPRSKSVPNLHDTHRRHERETKKNGPKLSISHLSDTQTLTDPKASVPGRSISLKRSVRLDLHVALPQTIAPPKIRCSPASRHANQTLYEAMLLPTADLMKSCELAKDDEIVPGSMFGSLNGAAINKTCQNQAHQSANNKDANDEVPESAIDQLTITSPNLPSHGLIPGAAAHQPRMSVGVLRPQSTYALIEPGGETSVKLGSSPFGPSASSPEPGSPVAPSDGGPGRKGPLRSLPRPVELPSTMSALDPPPRKRALTPAHSTISSNLSRSSSDLKAARDVSERVPCAPPLPEAHTSPRPGTRTRTPSHHSRPASPPSSPSSMSPVICTTATNRACPSPVLLYEFRKSASESLERVRRQSLPLPPRVLSPVPDTVMDGVKRLSGLVSRRQSGSGSHRTHTRTGSWAPMMSTPLRRSSVASETGDMIDSRADDLDTRSTDQPRCREVESEDDPNDFYPDSDVLSAVGAQLTEPTEDMERNRTETAREQTQRPADKVLEAASRESPSVPSKRRIQGKPSRVSLIKIDNCKSVDRGVVSPTTSISPISNQSTSSHSFIDLDKYIDQADLFYQAPASPRRDLIKDYDERISEWQTKSGNSRGLGTGEGKLKNVIEARVEDRAIGAASSLQFRGSFSSSLSHSSGNPRSRLIDEILAEYIGGAKSGRSSTVDQFRDSLLVDKRIVSQISEEIGASDENIHTNVESIDSHEESVNLMNRKLNNTNNSNTNNKHLEEGPMMKSKKNKSLVHYNNKIPSIESIVDAFEAGLKK